MLEHQKKIYTISHELGRNTRNPKEKHVIENFIT